MYLMLLFAFRACVCRDCAVLCWALVSLLLLLLLLSFVAVVAVTTNNTNDDQIFSATKRLFATITHTHTHTNIRSLYAFDFHTLNRLNKFAVSVPILLSSIHALITTRNNKKCEDFIQNVKKMTRKALIIFLSLSLSFGWGRW